MDREVINPLLRLFNKRIAIKFPAQSVGVVIDLLQRLIKRHGADRGRCIAHDPFTGVVNVRPGGEIHHRVRAPQRGPLHLFHLLLNGGAECGITDVGIDLCAELPADDHRLGLWMIDIQRDHGAAGGNLRPHKFRLNLLADRDKLHFRGNDTLPRIGQLCNRLSVPRTQRPALQSAKGLVGIRQDFNAGCRLLDIAALHDPVGADRGKPLLQVRLESGIRIRSAHIVQAQIFIVAMQPDLPERHPDIRTRALDIDLLRPWKIFTVTLHAPLSVLRYTFAGSCAAGSIKF